MQVQKRTPTEKKHRLIREYLRREADELQAHLEILSLQAAAIAGDETERIQRYMSLEQASITRLERLSLAVKAISGSGGGESLRPAPDLEELRATLGALGREALVRNAANRSALRAKMTELRRELENRPLGRKRGSTHLPSPYARIGRPSLVDMHR
jgi:hypothetical protein